jgi:tRNA(fMet)-specific endonuclease VapC
MYLIDTDVLGHLQRGHAKVVQRYLSVPRHELAITIVNKIEVLKARYESILKAANAAELKVAQHWLDESERLLAEWMVLRIDEAACRTFESLMAERRLRRIGRADLLIASITIANKATLVTRNVRDFQLVAGLKMENWVD